jgi:hypothetical protein
MGILLILLGLGAGAAVADFIIENHLATAPDQAFKLFGNHWHLSEPELVLGGAVLGALAVALLAVGFGLLGHGLGRRRVARAERKDLEGQLATLRIRTIDLQDQNASLTGENEDLRSRLDALEFDGLRRRLDAQAAQEQEAPELGTQVEGSSAPREAHATST